MATFKVTFQSDDVIPVKMSGNSRQFHATMDGPGSDYFQGPYVYTPSTQTQTISAAGLTMRQNIIINPIPGTYVNPSDATADASKIVGPYTAYVSTGKVTGSIVNRGSLSGTITSKSDTVSILEGCYSGGSVSIAQAQQDLIVPGNIRAGVTILGQAGKTEVVDTEISSDAAAAATIVNGKKAYVNGVLITGSHVPVQVSQDSTTNILSIS